MATFQGAGEQEGIQCQLRQQYTENHQNQEPPGLSYHTHYLPQQGCLQSQEADYQHPASWPAQEECHQLQYESPEIYQPQEEPHQSRFQSQEIYALQEPTQSQQYTQPQEFYVSHRFRPVHPVQEPTPPQESVQPQEFYQSQGVHLVQQPTQSPESIQPHEFYHQTQGAHPAQEPIQSHQIYQIPDSHQALLQHLQPEEFYQDQEFYLTQEPIHSTQVYDSQKSLHPDLQPHDQYYEPQGSCQRWDETQPCHDSNTNPGDATVTPHPQVLAAPKGRTKTVAPKGPPKTRVRKRTPDPNAPKGPLRTRNPIACDVCRERKSKCVGSSPCAHCALFDLACTYHSGITAPPMRTGLADKTERRVARLTREIADLVESQAETGRKIKHLQAGVIRMIRQDTS